MKLKNLITLIALAVIFNSCAVNNSNNNNAVNKSAAKVEKMKRFYEEVMNAHNIAVLDTFCTPGFIDHQADPRYPAGMEGLRASFTDFFIAFPDVHAKINFVIASGDTVMAQITMSGTNTGTFMGMPPTNKQFTIDGVDIVVINDDNKATEHWGFSEESKMMAQLNPAPPAVPAKK